MLHVARVDVHGTPLCGALSTTCVIIAVSSLGVRLRQLTEAAELEGLRACPACMQWLRVIDIEKGRMGAAPWALAQWAKEPREGVAVVRRANHTIRIFYWQLTSMPEYSISLPTGQTPFKMWRRTYNADGRRKLPDARLVGQYHPVDEPGMFGVRWFAVSLLHGPMPPGWVAPDWMGNAACTSAVLCRG
jgi:hypothetical protein